MVFPARGAVLGVWNMPEVLVLADGTLWHRTGTVSVSSLFLYKKMCGCAPNIEVLFP